jgi:flagellar basal-body rod modification protein FlgD
MSAIDAISGLFGEPEPVGTGSDVLGKQEFLKILMTQLKNQDPLNPIDDKEFISQMAQLSTLEATNNLGTQLNGLVAAQQQTQAMTLVGRDIRFLNQDGALVDGRVTGVRLDTAPPTLVLGDTEVPLTSVQTVL